MPESNHWHSVESIIDLRNKNWPEYVTPVSQLMMRIFRFSKVMLERTTVICEAHGLAYAELEVLAALRSVPAPYQLLPTELTGAVLLSSGGLTKVLINLESKGLISRQHSKMDRRSKPVRLTKDGKKLVQIVMHALINSDSSDLKGAPSRKASATGITDEEISQLGHLMRKFLQTVE